MSSFALNRLKIVLAERGITNRQLAQALGKAESTVSQWCTNAKQPSLETFFKIAQFVDIDIRELIVKSKQG
jgi:putative transcriptional regulator